MKIETSLYLNVNLKLNIHSTQVTTHILIFDFIFMPKIYF